MNFPTGHLTMIIPINRRRFALSTKITGTIFSVLFLLLALASGSALAKDLNQQATENYKLGKYTEAHSQFETWLKTHPQDAAAHYYLGMCYQQLAKEEFRWVRQNSNAPTPAKTSKDVPAPTAGAVSSGKHPKVLDFSAVWCGPCKRFAPTFDRLASKYSGRVDFIHADVDSPKFKNLAQKYQVNVVPTLVFLTADGRTSCIHQGVPDESVVIKQTEKLLR